MVVFNSVSFADVYFDPDMFLDDKPSNSNTVSNNNSRIEEERLQKEKRNKIYIISGVSVAVVSVGTVIFIIKRRKR